MPSSRSESDARRTPKGGRNRRRPGSATKTSGWRGPLALLAAMAGLWIASATALAGGGSGGGSGSGSPGTVQITECGSGTTTSTCQQSTTTLQPSQPSKPGPHRSTGSQASSTQSPPAGSEVHVYSLSTGKGTVTTSAGKRVNDKAAVQLAPGVSAPSAPATKPKTKLPGAVPSTPPVMPPVVTNGGSGFAGFTSPYSGLTLVSTDQALSQFQIPPFLMPVYMAASRAYGVPWSVLASINKIESDFGRNLNVSSAGAVGWMQFMPASWKEYAVDANNDGYADPFDPADAIFAAARYLHDAGASTNLAQAIFAYNHATWYVDEVLQTAGVYGSLPPSLVSETGSLAYGRFPLLGPATYGDNFASATLAGRRPQPLQIAGRGGATAVATQQVRVSRILLDPALAADLKLHGLLGSVAATYTPAETVPGSSSASLLPSAPALLAPASAFLHPLTGLSLSTPAEIIPPTAVSPTRSTPRRTIRSTQGAGLPAGFGVDRTPGITVVVSDPQGNEYTYGGLGSLPGDVRPGAVLAGGRPIGTLPSGPTGVLDFSVAAAGGVPVDPRPLVDGYRLQEAIHFYRAVAPFGANPFVPQTTTTSYAGYVSPFQGYAPIAERIDMGVDYSAPAGSPLVAIGAGRVIGISPNWYAGQPFVDYQITSGPLAGVYVYYAEQLTPTVTPGQLVSAGQPIARVAASGTGLELGFGTGAPGQTLAQVTGGYAEGALTAAGQAFSNLMLAVGAPPGLAEGRTMVGLTAGLPSVGRLGADPAPHVTAVAPQPATRAQEAAIAQALNRISNPKLAKPSPFAIKVPAERTPNVGTGAQPLTLQPSGAGARLVAITTPAGASGGRAWAVGTVDGRLHSGWARNQTVVMRFDQGVWSVVGPPRNSAGQVVNPRLRALAVSASGTGYAVGDRGAVVEMTRGKAAELLAAPTHTSLSAVALTAERGQPRALAVGARGTILELAGKAVQLGPSIKGRPDLTTLTVDRAGALIAGNSPAGPVLYRDAGGTIAPLPLQLGLPANAQTQITSVAERGDQLWLAGGVIDMSGETPVSPLAARQSASGWQTFCASGAELSGAVELGTPTPSVCGATLPVGAQAGPASAVVLTQHAVLLGTPDGLLAAAAAEKSFQPLCAGSCSTEQQPVSGLAVGADGLGWSLDAGTQLMQVSSRMAPAAAVAVPLAPKAGATGPATVVAPVPGSASALAAGAGAAVSVGSAKPESVRAPGVALRSLALTQPEVGWGITDTGALVRFAGGRWSDGAGAPLSGLAGLTRQLGGAPLSSSDQPLSAGLNALSLADPGDGYAVGGQGLILHYQRGAWKPEPSGTTETLTGVATGAGQAVAVGAHGTLLEPAGRGWQPSTQASSLVGGQDFSSVVALPDGTFLALAGSSLIARQPGNTTWGAAPLAPLGVAPTRLAAYRDFAGQLHALALISGAGGQALLDGDSSGWTPVTLPGGMAVSDLQVDQTGRQVWLAGEVAGRPVASQLPLPGDVIPASLINTAAAAPAVGPISAAPTTAGPAPAPSGVVGSPSSGLGSSPAGADLMGALDL